MNKFFILAITLWFALPANSQQLEEDTAYIEDTAVQNEVPRIRKYPARLWEVSGNGLKQPSYLYGTMHVSKKLAFNLGDTFYKALQAVDVVALELQIDSWLNNIGRNKETGPQGFDEAAGYYSSNQNGIYSTALDFKSSNLRSVLGELNNYDYMSNYLLYRQGYQSPNYSEKTYVDMYIHQTGKKLGKYCTGLEDFEISRNMVNRSDWRERTLTRKGAYSEYGGYGYGYGEDPTETAYREGDLDLIDSLDRMTNTNKFYRKWMLYERNKIMADQFEMITKNKRLFAAVGCAHLPGDSGVIEFLRRKGFTVKPVYDNVGEYAFKQKLKLEGISYPVSFSKYYSHNGELEFNLPGKPVDRSYLNNEEIFYADVANGAYYILKRMPWYGNIKGISREKFLKQIDSALFENVPGDITSKEKLTIGGNPALLISNRTKSGETQKHMFLVMQNHIWYVKISATGSYAEGREAKDFFKSISLKKAKSEWTKYEPQSGGYSLLWPSPVTIKPYSFDTSTDFRGHENLEFTDNKDNYYFLNRINVSNYDADSDTFHMHQMALNYAYYHQGNIEKTEFKKINGHQAFTATLYFPNEKKHLHFLLAADKDFYYYLGTYTEEKSPPQDFLNKFNFTDFKYKYQPEKRYDSLAKIEYARTGWVAVIKEYRHKEEEKALKKREMIYPALDYTEYGYAASFNEDSLSADYKFASPVEFPTGESVTITKWKSSALAPVSNFDQLVKRGVLKGRIIDMKRFRFIADSLELVLEKEYKKEKKVKYYYHINDRPFLDTLYWAGDWLISEQITGSKNNMRRNYIYSATSENDVYSAFTQYDDVRGISPVVSGILKSIELRNDKRRNLDSQTFARDIIAKLSGTDSIALFKAMDNRYNMGLIPAKYNDTLFKLMKKFSQNTDWGADYADMIESELVKDHYLPLIGYYMDKFRRVGDTSEIQAKMLSSLARLKNKTAMDTLIYWLLEETPLAPEGSYSNYTYSGVITNAFDSLKLWKEYYKRLLPLSRYKEYGDAIMTLGLIMLDSNFIDSSIFKSMVPELTLAFRDDLKRKMSKSTGYNYGYNSGSNYRNYHAEPDDAHYEYGSSYNGLFINTGNSWYSGYSEYNSTYTEYAVYSLQHMTHLASLNSGWYSPPLSANNYNIASGSSSLFEKARILVKYYNSDPDVSKRLNRIYLLKEKEEKMLYLDLFLKNGITMPDSMYNYYLSKKDCEFGFVQMLKKRNLMNKIPANYFTEKNYVTSFVNYHHFSEKDDSIVFIGKKSANVENETGNLYFWKSRMKEKKGEKSDIPWQYSVVWIGSKDTLSTLKYPKYYRFNMELNKKYNTRDMMNNEAAILQYWKHYFWLPMSPKDEETGFEPYEYEGE